jgi:hypothetical protein
MNTIFSTDHRRGLLALAALLFTTHSRAGTIIGHVEASAASTLPLATMNAVGQQKWLFTHASVGGNIIEGMQALHDADANRYPLVMETSGDWSSIFAPPATTTPGTIYDAPRGNPGWEEKFTLFDQAVRTQGWHYPVIDIVMDKLCYIDQDANPTNYLAMMTALRRDYPATVFVFTTMPLESDENEANVLRSGYNNTVRNYCRTNACVLLDVADIESHDPSGNPVTFTNETGIYERLYNGYTSDGGHLEAVGRERVALGWYAAAAALVNPIQWTTNTLPAGLVAWWQAEGSLLDSAGTNHGSSSTVNFAPGRFGQSFVFSGDNQSVTIPHAEELNVPPTGFTVEFWMKAGKDQPEAISSIVDKDHSARDSAGWEVSCWRDTGRLSFGIGNGVSFPLCTNLTDVLDNQFHHVAFAWNRTNWLIYVNGVLENSLYRPTVANNTRPLRFGYHWGDGTGTPMRFFRGVLDDVRIYNRALTGTEIARLALGLPGANGFWGIKTHDPISQAPTTMFWFDENGTNYRELACVTLTGAQIEADGMAMSPAGALFAFQVNTAGGSRLLSLNPSNAVAAIIGPVLTGRDIRGATFTLSGRLLAFDCALRELVEINPDTGLQVGDAVPLSTNVSFTTTAGDLTQMPDGSLLFAYHDFLYALDSRTGTLTPLYQDKTSLPDGNVPYCCGIACVPGSDPANKLYCYEASQDDSVYQYLPSSNYTRLLLVNNVVPGYNAGRGDLAALPGALVELQSFSVSGAVASISAVCRAGMQTRIEYSDNLGTNHWQTVSGTAGWVPQTPGSIATPMTWTNLPAGVSNRFFRVALP